MSNILTDTIQKEFKNLFNSKISLDTESFMSYINDNSLNESEKEDINRTLMTNMYLQMTFFDNIKHKVSEDIKSQFDDTISSYKEEIGNLNSKLSDMDNTLKKELLSKEELEKKCTELQNEKSNLEEENNMKSKPTNQISILKKYDDKIVERDSQISSLKKEIERLTFRISQFETQDESNDDSKDDNEEDSQDENEEDGLEEVDIKGKKYLYDGEKYFYECGEDNDSPVGYKDSKGKYKFYKKK